MTLFTDDFNRADSTDLGAGWVEVSGGWAIASNRLSPGSAGGTIALRAAQAMATDDNYAQVTIAAAGPASHGVVCRGNANFTSGYLWRNDGASWDLFSIVGGSFSNIGTSAGASQPGDVAKVQADGTTIKGFVNGVELVSVTDTFVATGTSVGIRSESAAALAFDDFTGSDMGATVTGTASFALGALSVTAIGTRTTFGTADFSLGGLALEAQGSVEVVAPVGSWFSLVSMIQEAADIDQRDRSTPPTSCPNDYTALREGPNGTLYCPWGCGTVWPNDASAWGEFPGSY